MNRCCIMTVAGSDSGGGAGIQADLKAFAALGCYGTSVVTAQSTVGVVKIEQISDEMVRAQMRVVLDDIGADAIKIGMLHCPGVVASELPEGVPVVLDPVMVATAGSELVDRTASNEMIRLLLPKVTLVTPNLKEATRILGHSIEDVEAAAKEFPCDVLITGGETGRDCLCFGGEVYWFSSPRVDTKNDHGTGCTLSSAIAAFMGRGYRLVEAVCAAKQYISGALQGSFDLGRGRGPLDHFWQQGKDTTGRVDHLAAVRDALEEKRPVRLSH